MTKITEDYRRIRIPLIQGTDEVGRWEDRENGVSTCTVKSLGFFPGKVARLSQVLFVMLFTINYFYELLLYLMNCFVPKYIYILYSSLYQKLLLFTLMYSTFLFIRSLWSWNLQSCSDLSREG